MLFIIKFRSFYLKVYYNPIKIGKTIHFSTDIKLIIECCKTQKSTITLEELISQIKNWDKFIDLAYAHGVFPIVYHTLKLHVDTIPTNILNSMKSYNMNIAKQNMLMTTELIKVMKLLEENNIEAISFKGPVLSQMAYGDITLRQYCDLDILIDEENISKATKLLENISYISQYQLEEYQREKLKNVVHDVALNNKNNGVRLECHWVLSSGEFYIDMKQWNDLEKPTYQTIQNRQIPTLSNEKLLVYLCVHGYKHMWERIEWLLDIYYLDLNNNINWDKVITLSRKIKAQRVLLSSLYLCEQIFSMKLDKNISKFINKEKELHKISNNMLKHIFSNNINNSKNSKYISYTQLYMLKDKRSKLKYIKTLFTPTENDYSKIKLPKYLNFLYYITRIFNIFSSKLKN